MPATAARGIHVHVHKSVLLLTKMLAAECRNTISWDLMKETDYDSCPSTKNAVLILVIIQLKFLSDDK